MNKIDLKNLKLNLLYVTRFYLENSNFKILSKNLVQKLYKQIKSNNKLQVNKDQLKSLIVCTLFYEDNMDDDKDINNTLPESSVDSLLIYLAGNFAKVLPRQKALKIAGVLATHKPNNPSDITKILDM